MEVSSSRRKIGPETVILAGKGHFGSKRVTWGKKAYVLGLGRVTLERKSYFINSTLKLRINDKTGSNGQIRAGSNCYFVTEG
jgi:hypothetical protein